VGVNNASAGKDAAGVIDSSATSTTSSLCPWRAGSNDADVDERPAVVTTCLLGCDRELAPMARWAPYRVCPSCGSGFFVPPPLDEYWAAGTEPSEAQDQRWSERSRQWAPVVGRGPGRALDIGCGFGHYVRWAREAGWDAWGYEPDDWARHRTVADPARIVAALDQLDGEFDVVTMWDVLEHSLEPVESARTLEKLLAPGGRLVVCSPNFEALQRRWWWLRLHPEHFTAFVRPHEHVTQFTPLGLELALTRAGYVDIARVQPPLSRAGVPGLDTVARHVPWLRQGLFVVARRAR
jgi:SAM-dependent methyltransferase